MAECWDIYDINGNKTGRITERGKAIYQGGFHLVVHVWIRNGKGEYLISQRTPNKTFPNMWECTGGSAVAGENSLLAALREVREELGIALPPEKGMLWKRIVRDYGIMPDLCDIWIFEFDFPIEDVVFQEGETCNAMWASKEKIYEMLENGEFVGRDIFTYIDELFEEVRH